MSSHWTRGPVSRSIGGRGRILCVCLSVALLACAEAAVGPDLAPAEIQLTLHGFATLEPVTQGSYEAWVIDAEAGVHSAGRFVAAGPDGQLISLESPISDPTDIMVTLEPPGDDDAVPSELPLVGGPFTGAMAELRYDRYLTPGVPLEPEPGTHVLFTPSDNAELGYPSHENSGIWIFNIDGDSADGSFFITLTPLTAGWTYEGWVVRDYGSSEEIWLSYGKFRPDDRRKVNTRDDSGLGPFSGQIDYVQAMPTEIYMPGDDWVANPHGYPVPGGLDLPIDLNGCMLTPAECAAVGVAHGPSRWTHVITIEPRSDELEEPWLARPSVVRPYRNAIGEAGWTTPRTIEFDPEALPRALARLGR